MKWSAFILLSSACAFFQNSALAQTSQSSELQKYPDIAYRIRAFELFRFLLADKEHEKGLKQSSEKFQRMDRAVTLISLQLTEEGVFIARDKPLSNEKLKRLSPAARAFYDYYRAALSNNPVFRDLYKPSPPLKTALYSSYRTHQSQGRSDSEQHAYEGAGNVLDEISVVPTSRFPWAWATVALLLPLVAAGAFVIQRRHAKSNVVQPKKS